MWVMIVDIRIISAAFASGIYLADTVGFANILLICTGAFITELVKTIIRHSVRYIFIFAALAFAAGAFLYKYTTLDEFSRLCSYISKDITVTGRICDVPYKSGEVMKYTVDARSVSSEDNTEEINEKLIVYSKDIFGCGDVVSFTGTLKDLPAQLNESGFNTAQYYKQRRINSRLTASAAQPSDMRIEGNGLGMAAANIKYSIDKLIDKYYTGDWAAAVKAVIAGNMHDFSDETKSLLLRTAMRRFFNPSYIHIMLLNTAIAATASVINKKRRDFIAIAVFAVFVILNMGSGSFVRGGLFVIAAAVLRRFLKKAYYFDVLAIAVIGAGLINPLILFNSGFILSAVGAAFIRAFYPYIIGLKIFKRETWAIRTVIMGTLCTFGMLPLVAYFFNSLSVYSIAAALVMYPAVTVIMLCAPFFLVSVALTGSSLIAGKIITSMTAVMFNVTKYIDTLPLSRIYVGTPSKLFIFAYMAAVGALAYIIRKKVSFSKFLAAVSAVSFAACIGIYVVNLDNIEVDFVNVGQGDGAVISRPLGAKLLIDGGGSEVYSDYDAGENIYLPYLIDKGITAADAAFVSHYHKDHVQGIAAALDNIKVKNIFMPDTMPDSEWRQLLEEKAKEQNTAVWYVNSNMKITFGDGLCAEITVPNEETRLSDDENDTSLLINISYGEFNCLFTGDMTRYAEKNLVDRGSIPQSDVLKVPHHGSKYSARMEFVSAAAPLYSIISLGENNPYGFPASEVLDRLKDTEIMRTDLNGDIRIISDMSGNIRVDNFRRGIDYGI